jgi:hypothetical protein
MANRWRFRRFLVLVAIVAASAARAEARDAASDMKKAGKSIAKAATKLGHDVADSSKKIGTSVAGAAEEGAKTAWFATRNWTTRESKQVADATVRWWDDVIRGKETKRDRLRHENASLKTKARDRKKNE